MKCYHFFLFSVKHTAETEDTNCRFYRENIYMVVTFSVKIQFAI